MRSTIHRTAGALGVAALLVVGSACSKDSAKAARFSSVGSAISGGGATGDVGAALPGNDAYARSGSTTSKSAATAGSSVKLTAAALGRQLVTVATLTVQVPNLGDAEASATTIATDAGGAVFGERSAAGAGATTTLTLKVPPERFRTVLAKLERLGKRLGKTISTDDVTSQVVDVDTRIKTLQDSIARVQALFDRAGTVVEVAQLDSELQRRQAELESLLGQQRTLRDQVSLTTITLTLTKHAPPPPKPHHAPPKGFRAGLHAGAHALSETARVASLVVGALLPWLPLVAVLSGLSWLASRTRRRRLAIAVPAPPPPPAA